MSETLIKIRDKFQTARKERDENVSKFLGTIIGKLDAIAVVVDGTKTVTEIQTIAVLKQFEKQNAELLEILKEKRIIATQALYEKKILESFLPQQLDESQIRAIFDTLEAKDMGSRMKHLKDNYSGQYDGKIASKVAKEEI